MLNYYLRRKQIKWKQIIKKKIWKIYMVLNFTDINDQLIPFQ
jgi:hypothetical protein